MSTALQRLPGIGRVKIYPVTGSPTEVALLHLAIMAGLNPEVHYREHPLQKVRLRSENRRYMVSVHATPEGRSMVWLNTALAVALAAQAGTILIPGFRRLLGKAPLAPVDLLAVGLTAWSTRSINRGFAVSARSKRRPPETLQDIRRQTVPRRGF